MDDGGTVGVCVGVDDGGTGGVIRAMLEGGRWERVGWWMVMDSGGESASSHR